MAERDQTKEVPTMIVATKVREFISSYGCRMSGDFTAELNEQLAKLVDSAVRRSESNNRNTVRPGDL